MTYEEEVCLLCYIWREVHPKYLAFGLSLFTAQKQKMPCFC
jgi:hypothetical protein